MISTDFLCVGLWGYVESAGDSQVFLAAIKLRAQTRGRSCTSAVKVERQKQFLCEEIGRSVGTGR